MKLKSYPKMKDSGIEWIGEIPEYWQVPSVSKIYNIQLGKMLQPERESDDDRLVPYLKANNVHWEVIETDTLPKMWANPFEITKYGLKNGDLLVCEGGEGGRSAMFSGEIENCIIQNALHRVRSTNNFDIKYMMYVLIYCNYVKWLDAINNKATIAHFTKEKFSSLKIPISFIVHEQKQIVCFLDKETSKINSEISKHQKLIESLKEKHQSIINQAVTKGLDPTVTMKNSGIQWIGEIPKHWNTSTMRQVIKYIKSGLSRLLSTEDDGYPVFRSTNMIGGKLDLTDVKYWHTEDTKGVNLYDYVLDDRDIILNFINSMAQIGKSCLFIKQDRDWIYTTNVFRIKTNLDKLIPEYYVYFLNSSYMKNLMISISQPAVNQASFTKDDFKQLFIMYPDLYTQNKIISFLNKETSKIDLLIKNVTSQIEKLKEFRQSMISSAVTGKMDLRNYPISA